MKAHFDGGEVTWRTLDGVTHTVGRPFGNPVKTGCGIVLEASGESRYDEVDCMACIASGTSGAMWGDDREH